MSKMLIIQTVPEDRHAERRIAKHAMAMANFVEAHGYKVDLSSPVLGKSIVAGPAWECRTELVATESLRMPQRFRFIRKIEANAIAIFAGAEILDVRARIFARDIAAACARQSPSVSLYISQCDWQKTRRLSAHEAGLTNHIRDFAQELRDRLCREGAHFCRVDLHMGVDPCRSGQLTRYLGLGTPRGGAGGMDLFDPHHAMSGRFRAVCAGTNLPYALWGLSFEQIHRIVAGIGPFPSWYSGTGG